VFTSFLLADEINRAPAKTQSALLQAMQERRVTIDRDTHALAPNFTVFATQNPIEYEGTYPLPEAQKDRFMFKITMRCPERDDELLLAQRMLGEDAPEAVLDRGEVRTVISASDLAGTGDLPGGPGAINAPARERSGGSWTARHASLAAGEPRLGGAQRSGLRYSG
jgi:MoxR-like ATPase